MRRLVAFVALLFVASCAEVRPWERAALAHRLAKVEPAPARAALKGHVLAAREGAVTSGGSAGGGCGCD